MKPVDKTLVVCIPLERCIIKWTLGMRKGEANCDRKAGQKGDTLLIRYPRKEMKLNRELLQTNLSYIYLLI